MNEASYSAWDRYTSALGLPDDYEDMEHKLGR